MNLFSEMFIDNNFSLMQFTLCIGISLLCGLILSLIDTIRDNTHSKSFVTTITILPPIVAIVIVVVGNSIGTGIAVAGAFSLVRFRSIPGTAEEIGVIFLAVTSGLLVGAGYLSYAIVFSLSLGGVYAFLSIVKYGSKKTQDFIKILKITIPEDLDYGTEIEDVIHKYTSFNELISMRSINMGSMFRLTYRVSLNLISEQKQFIDALRVRNGNLEIVLVNEVSEKREL